MKLFRKANRDATDTYYFGEGEDRDWIRVRSSLTKAEANKVLGNVPREERDLEGGFAFMESFFEYVVIDWSFVEVDEEGNERKVPATLSNFREMDASGARLIEDQLAKHLNKVLGREVEKLEGE
jgi:hypothetical protein